MAPPPAASHRETFKFTVEAVEQAVFLQLGNTGSGIFDQDPGVLTIRRITDGLFQEVVRKGWLTPPPEWVPLFGERAGTLELVLAGIQPLHGGEAAAHDSGDGLVKG